MEVLMSKIRFPLKLKFSFLISLLVVFLIVIIGYSLIDYLETKLTDEVLKRGTQLAKNFASVALENYTTGYEFPIVVYSANLTKEEGIKDAFFITGDGFIVAHSDSSKITPEPDKDIMGTEFAVLFKPSEEYNKPFFLKGKGVIQADYNRLDLNQLATDNGEIIISYHWMKNLKASPETKLERVFIGDDPIGFIRIVDPPPSLVIYNGY